MAFAVTPLSPCDLSELGFRPCSVLAGVCARRRKARSRRMSVKSGLWFPVTEFRLDTREGRTVGRHLKNQGFPFELSVSWNECPVLRAGLPAPSSCPVCVPSAPALRPSASSCFCWSPWDLKLLLAVKFTPQLVAAP